MSFYHYRKDDLRNNIGGKAIHLLHRQDGKYQTTALGICWRRNEASLIELAVFGVFFRWYFRIRSKASMERIRIANPLDDKVEKVISDIEWVWLHKMYRDAEDFYDA